MEQSSNKPSSNRKRSATYLSLDWLARKIRRSNLIKSKLQTGDYHIESESLAKVLLNDPEPFKE